MPDESLLTDEVRALIGCETALGTVQVTPRAWRRALEVYTGRIPEGSPAAGEPVAGYVIAALDSDSESAQLPNLMPNSILISNEWRFERPFRMGETLETSYAMVDITKRFGARFGYSIDFRSEVLYRDANGSVIARSSRTMTQYSANNTAPDGAA